ncbi:31667_t:CDS:2, partial [Gigaspora margarita]
MNCFEGFRFLFQILKAAIFPWISYTEAIISRKLLYGNPDRLSPKISYDGKYLAFMAPKDDVMNIFVCDPKDPNNKEKIKAVTSAKYHGIREYYWTYGNEILYSQDYKGDEYYKIYAFNIDTNQTKCLTPFNKTQSRLVHLSPKFPQDAIIKINKPDPTAYSLYKINIITGVYALIESSEYSFTEYVVDDSLKFRCATKITDDGGKEIYLKNQNSGKWELLITYGMDDTRSSYVISLDTSGNIYLVDSRDKEFNAIYKLDTNDKEKKLQLVAMPSDQKADMNKILLHPTKRIPIAYSVAYLKDDWYPIDEKISLDLK